MSARVDLNLHTRHSNRSAEWLLRRFEFPDSYSDPAQLHQQLLKAGMRFVTFTDHNTLAGCLEIAGRPDVFLSAEVTTYFPEDRCKIHLLVWNITEAQFRVIDRARENIFDLVRYLGEEQIAHGVAHPLYSINGKLTPAHVERLLLLFRVFEGVNGYREGLLGATLRFILPRLTREKIEFLANQYGIEPVGEEPWLKIVVGGSDDHGGIYAGQSFTAIPGDAASPADFFRELLAGRAAPAGRDGTPLALSHSLFRTIHAYVKDKYSEKLGANAHLVQTMVDRFIQGRDPTDLSFGEKLSFVAQGIVTGRIFELAKPLNASMWHDLSSAFSQADLKAILAEETVGIPEPERRAFVIANLFADKLAFRFFTRFVDHISKGAVLESLQSLTGFVPIVVLLSPYLYAFHSQAPDRRLLRACCQSLADAIPPELQNRKRAWFTDTLEDVNGVATTIRKMTAAGIAAGADLVVVTSRDSIGELGIPIKNFPPIGEFEIPEYELQKLSFPPILKILDYIQREGFTELIISTPGPIGVTALLAAKMLGIRATGIYHTDFPQYVRILTDDTYLETLAWNYMHWFYGQLDTVFVNSEHYRRAWIERGIEPARLAILPRGLDVELFRPEACDPTFWTSRGKAPEEIGLLYVGRLSKEKDLDLLVAAVTQLREREGLPVRLLLVGDGPYAAELRTQLPDAIFTGYLGGEWLATAYASADLFGFPSTTDTYGNVVVEAMATGLPVVVSDLGGPKELVDHGRNGLITRALDVEDFTQAIRQLVKDPALRTAMGRMGRETVKHRDWGHAFQRFWHLNQPASETSPRQTGASAGSAPS